jgi:hypothetical protein
MATHSTGGGSLRRRVLRHFAAFRGGCISGYQEGVRAVTGASMRRIVFDATYIII